jgi:predicted acyl esterase
MRARNAKERESGYLKRKEKNMGEPNSSQLSRRDLLKTVAGVAAAGAAGLGISPAMAQESPSKEPAKEKIEIIFSKGRPLDDPSCRYPGFAPGVRIEDGMRIERDVAVKMRDGITIYTDIYRPDGATNLPAIVAWSPGGKQPRDREGGMPGVPHGSGYGLYEVSRYARGEGPDPVYWCKYGYALLNPDPRGAMHSEGKGYRWGGTVEGQDAHDLIEWVGIRDWSNGKVTMSGNSTLAIAQWAAAAERPPHLAAIAPWEGWTDFYRQIICPGGIPETGFSGRGRPQRCAEDGVEDLVAMLDKYPLMNSYWEDKIPKLDRINVPTYITANFKHFHLLGSLEAFRVIPVQDKWLRFINNFEWPDYYAPASMDDLRHFFDRYLKGEKNDWELTPRVRLAVLDPGGMDILNRPEKEWPLARTKYEKLYLAADTDSTKGTLSTQPVQRESQTSYVNQNGQANFVIKFDKETELTGYFKLRLWVEADGADDLDLFVYVQKLDRRGAWLPSLVFGWPHPGAQGWMRVSHRELDPARSTPSEPFQTHRRLQKLRPKEIVPVEIGVWPTSMLWHPGQQLRVLIASRWMREPGWFEPFRYENFTQGSCIIHTGGKYDSHLLIPNIPL